MNRPWSRIAKITRPRVSEMYPRERLLSLLDCARERPVIWVSGPGGSGKTSLVSNYLDARGARSLWHQLDAGDADIATLFYYLSMAERNASPRRRKHLPLLTHQHLLDIPTFTRRFFESLYRRLGTHSVLVFDNYQDVPEASPLHEIMANGLDVIPEGTNVIIMSRGGPPEPMARLLAARRVFLIGWDDLRVADEEVEAIVEVQRKGKPYLPFARRLNRSLDGWVAGLILWIEWAEAEGGGCCQVLCDHVPRMIFDYFAGEVLAKMDETSRKLLMETALLPDMSPEICVELTGIKQAGKILADLHRKNYFTVSHLHGQTSTYQYHPLFRRFLTTVARAGYDAEAFARLRLRAAELLEKHGQAEDAADLYMECGYWKALARLITCNAPSLLGTGRSRTLERWLKSLPPEILESEPWLISWMGACRSGHSPAAARQDFERAFEAFKKMGNAAGQYISWCGIVESYVNEWGHFSGLDRWIAEFDAVMGRCPGFPSREIEIRATAAIFNAVILRRPHKDLLDYWEGEARDLLPHCGGDINLRILLLNPLLLMHLWLGNYPKVALLLEELAEDQSAASTDLFPKMFKKCYEVIYLWQTARHQEGLRAVAEGLAMAEKSGIDYWNTYFHIQAVHCLLGTGDLASAAGYLSRIASGLNTTRIMDVSHYHFISSWAAVLGGDLRRAMEHGEMGLRLAMECGSPWPVAVNHNSIAGIVFQCGQAGRAFLHATKARKIARMMGSPYVEYKSILMAAFFMLRTGRGKKGLSYLERAMKTGRDKDYVSMDCWRPDVMTFLCEAALDAGIEVEYVRGLVRKRGLRPSGSCGRLENWPYLFKIHTLGTFSVRKGGEPLAFSGKVQQRPLAMLKALIALGGRNVPQDVLTDALWPEAEGDHAHISLETTLHRLRRLLGEPAAVRLKDGALSLDDGVFWVDAWAFEEAACKAEALRGSRDETAGTIHVREGARVAGRLPAIERIEDAGRLEEAVRLAERAVSLYKGPFLSSDVQQLWAVSPRERLKALFLSTVFKLGSHWEASGEWEKAARCFEQGLRGDDLQEEFYQHLMICHHRLGRKGMALATYQRCRAVLAAALGVDPSPEIEATLSILK